MIEPLDASGGITRTGHFLFRVWRRDGGAWDWKLRVEVVDTGDCGTFDTMQDALRFMRQHLIADEDVEVGIEAHPSGSESAAMRLDGAMDPAKPVG